jgi:hypothetical protein
MNAKKNRKDVRGFIINTYLEINLSSKNPYMEPKLSEF